MAERNQETSNRNREIVQLNPRYLAGIIASSAIGSALLTSGNEKAQIAGAVLFLSSAVSPIALRLANVRFYSRQTFSGDTREGIA